MPCYCQLDRRCRATASAPSVSGAQLPSAVQPQLQEDSPGRSQFDDAWVCTELLDLIAQYPGGLSEPVLLASLVAKSLGRGKPPAVFHASGEEAAASLAVAARGHVPAGALVTAGVTCVECLSMHPAASPEAPAGGPWVIHLDDASTRMPVPVYAPASLTGLLAQRGRNLGGRASEAGRVEEGAAGCGGVAARSHEGGHALVGAAHVLFAGPLRTPHRPSLGARRARRGGSGGGAAPPSPRYPLLPPQALALQLPSHDAAWQAADLRGHPLLAAVGFTCVHELLAVREHKRVGGF
eukprot:363053-Chlamydomonas_euryale.AAC.10